MRPQFEWSPRISEAEEPAEAEPEAQAEATSPEPAESALEHDDTIRMDAEQAEEVIGPRSRPTLNDTPRALHTTETEDELDFFLAGEEGRYEGGPATLVPLAIDDEEEESPRLPPPDPAVLARRGRNVRVVSMIVGAMAAIFGVGLVRGNATAQSPAEPVEVAAQVAPAQPKPVALAVAEKEPEPAAPAQPEPAAAPEPEPAPAAEAPEPEPAAAAPAPEPKKVAAAPKPRVRHDAALLSAPKPEPAPEPAPPPAPIEPSGPPPTAAFPTP